MFQISPPDILRCGAVMTMPKKHISNAEIPSTAYISLIIILRHFLCKCRKTRFFLRSFLHHLCSSLKFNFNGLNYSLQATTHTSEHRQTYKKVYKQLCPMITIFFHSLKEPHRSKCILLHSAELASGKGNDVSQLVTPQSEYF